MLKTLIADVREGYLFDTRHEPGMFARNEMPDWCREVCWGLPPPGDASGGGTIEMRASLKIELLLNNNIPLICDA